MIFIHGGYWRSLEPRSFSHMAAGANRHGYAVAVVGYRLCPEVRIGEIIDDVRAACLFLQRRLGRRMVACGHSAGGHLTAALVATDWRALDPASTEGLIRSGLAISGVFELRPIVHTEMNVQARMDDAEAQSLSPVLWTPPPDARLEAFVGSEESSEFLRQSRFIAERWTAAGAKARAELIPGANHFTAPNPLNEPQSRLTRALIDLCEAAT